MISEVRGTKHKGGRPRKLVKRKVVSIRLNSKELLVVNNKAKKAGLKITVCIRQMSLKGKVISRLDEEEKQIVKQLVSMSNNLNQLTKRGHKEGFLKAVLVFEKYRNSFDELLQRIKR